MLLLIQHILHILHLDRTVPPAADRQFHAAREHEHPLFHALDFVHIDDDAMVTFKEALVVQQPLRAPLIGERAREVKIALFEDDVQSAAFNVGIENLLERDLQGASVVFHAENVRRLIATCEDMTQGGLKGLLIRPQRLEEVAVGKDAIGPPSDAPRSS